MSAKNQASYRGASLVFFFSLLFHVAVALFLWLSASNANYPIFTKPQLIGYFVLLLFFDWSLNLSMFSSTTRDIRNGDILKELMMPYSYFIALFARGAGFKAMSSILFLLGTVIVAILIVLAHAPLELPHPTAQTVVLALMASAIAMFANFTIRFCMGICAFWLTDVTFLDMTYYTIFPFLSGEIIPVAFLPAVVQRVNDWLPFRYQLSFPIELLYQKLNNQQIFQGFAVGITWCILYYLLYKFLWKRGSKAYTAFGH